MKELQEIDIDAAPLLFHAASSRREHSCFRTAYGLIYRVLGKGGVMDQVEAVDGLGRRILMHAARSNHVQTFREVLAICKETIDEINLFEIVPAVTETSAESKVLIKTRIDINGMNCLHHAAQAGCCEVLREVMAMYRQSGSPDLRTEINKKDKSLYTPIMYVLRDRECRREKEHACGNDDLEEKFNMLFREMATIPDPRPGKHAKEGWMEPMQVLSQVVPTKGQAPIRTTAVTELMHAAQGGRGSLTRALNNPLPGSNLDSDDGLHRIVDLEKALDVEVCDESDGHQTGDPKTWGNALLLAAAAKLGDVDVLKVVVGAIKVSPKRLGHTKYD